MGAWLRRSPLRSLDAAAAAVCWICARGTAPAPAPLQHEANGLHQPRSMSLFHSAKVFLGVLFCFCVSCMKQGLCATKIVLCFQEVCGLELLKSVDIKG